MDMTMPGGYVYRTRYLIPKMKSLNGPLVNNEPTGFVRNRALRFGSLQEFNQQDLRTLQSTYSFRTSKDGQMPDLISGQAILSYFLQRGIPSSLDNGHEFYTTKTYQTFSHTDVLMSSQSGTTWARGCIVPNGGPQIPNIPILDVNYYGNKAISRIAPTAPNANLAQTAAEILREKGLKLPSNEYADWLKSRATLAQTAGRGYLNLSFGWIPLISDLVKIVKQLLNITEEIRRYTTLSTLETVRRYDFQTDDQVSQTPISRVNLNIGPDSNIDNWSELYVNGKYNGTGTRTDKLSQRIYLKAKFTYALNPGKGLLDQLETYESIANKLLGTRITPAVLWELTPWSWLVDWIVDIQSALTSASLLQNDGLLMHYAYLMRETHASTTYTTSDIEFIDGPRGPFHATTHYVKKERVRGTPFGFGLNPSQFTDRQWAILTALALSKSGEYRG